MSRVPLWDTLRADSPSRGQVVLATGASGASTFLVGTSSGLRELQGDPMTIKTKRAYDPPEQQDGARFLVDRLWPRGAKRESLPLKEWLRDVAPSDELRRWFGHDPEKWEEFQRRYWAELDGKAEVWQPLVQAAQQDQVTLLYGARNRQHNNAVALKAYLDQQLESHPSAEKP